MRRRNGRARSVADNGDGQYGQYCIVETVMSASFFRSGGSEFPCWGVQREMDADRNRTPIMEGAVGYGGKKEDGEEEGCQETDDQAVAQEEARGEEEDDQAVAQEEARGEEEDDQAVTQEEARGEEACPEEACCENRTRDEEVSLPGRRCARHAQRRQDGRRRPETAWTQAGRFSWRPVRSLSAGRFPTRLAGVPLARLAAAASRPLCRVLGS